MPISPLMMIFAIAGLTAGTSLQNLITQREGLGLGAHLGLLAAAALLLLWNVRMYLRAANSNEYGDSSLAGIVGFIKPVAATASFLLGASVIFF